MAHQQCLELRPNSASWPLFCSPTGRTQRAAGRAMEAMFGRTIQALPPLQSPTGGRSFLALHTRSHSVQLSAPIDCFVWIWMHISPQGPNCAPNNRPAAYDLDTWPAKWAPVERQTRNPITGLPWTPHLLAHHLEPLCAPPAAHEPPTTMNCIQLMISRHPINCGPPKSRMGRPIWSQG